MKAKLLVAVRDLEEQPIRNRTHAKCLDLESTLRKTDNRGSLGQDHGEMNASTYLSDLRVYLVLATSHLRFTKSGLWAFQQGWH